MRVWPRAELFRRLTLSTTLVLTACGGGGGGGGGGPAPGGGGNPPAAGAVVFEGFSFRSGSGITTMIPPLEDPLSVPPKVGAGLNTVVVFSFSGVPQGPFNQQTLPVFTTPAEVTPAAKAPGTLGTIPAKGTYSLIVDVGADVYTVEFRPFLPVGDVNPNLAADPATVPGLLPGSVYTASVSSVPGVKIPNLQGPGGTVKFGTTSNAAAYFPVDPSESEPPAVVYTDGSGALVTTPADGSGDFFPGVYSPVALDSVADTFPPGPADVLLTYDRPVIPTSANIVGSDLDGDGFDDPTFFLSARATRLLLGHEVPANAVAGAPPHGAFDAVSALVDGAVGDLSGGDVLAHDSPSVGLDGETAALGGLVKALASGRDANLLYVVTDVPGGNDLVTVGDHFGGDPAAAALAVDAPLGTGLALDSGLDDLVGLEVLLDGRLVGYDRTSRTVVELAFGIDRQRATPEKPTNDPPVLDSVSIGDGVGLFRSMTWPSGLDVHDLAQAPSGRLYAVATVAGASFPSLLELAPIDPDVDGEFGPEDGTWSGSTADVVLAFSDHIEQLEFLTEDRALVLDRSLDRIAELDLVSGALTSVATDVAGFGLPLSGGKSPARAFAIGHMQIDVVTTLAANTSEGAVVSLTPHGVLPVGEALTVMQRQGFTSLSGYSLVNADPASPRSPLGAVDVLSFHTAVPVAGAGAPVDDVFFEGFSDQHFENATPISTSPSADWAELLPGIGPSGGLRASVGVTETAQLGDFRPVPEGNFNPNLAWVRADLPWIGGHAPEDNEELALDLTRANYAVVVLDTDTQTFPLPGGITPGVTAPQTVVGGNFVFRDFIIPEGVHVIAQGSRPLRITATGRVEIRGMLDVRGTDGLGDDTFDSAFLPVPGGSGGPGAGRGGDAHPTLFDPNGSGQIDQYVTPERSERGWGPVVGASGSVIQARVGGEGALSTVGYTPVGAGFPNVPPAQPSGGVPNNENHRPPGGGGGSFYQSGFRSNPGAGSYLVQAESTWWPFSRCVGNEDNINFALYGNEENIVSGVAGATNLQCVYMTGSPADPDRIQMFSLPGDPVFANGDPSDDFIGPGGELEVLVGGQGGGGGGTRVDSLNHALWAFDRLGSPFPAPPAPPYYPVLNAGSVFFSPTLFDAKGGAGGGGGGSVQIRSFGDILITRTGHIDARGGHGGGGEVVQNSQIGGGGGGGSGGAVLLQAGGGIVIEADQGHRAASYTDKNGLEGASIEVSGGFGREAQTETPTNNFSIQPYTYDSNRGDGGQGGFGMIQLQSGGGADSVQVADGAFLFAKQRSTIKLGAWNGGTNADQADHPDFLGNGANDVDPELLFIDLLHYRSFQPEPTVDADHYMVLNGSYPPVIESVDGNNGPGLTNEYPAGSGQFWGDTRTEVIGIAGGVRVVQEPEPARIMKTYLGVDPETGDEFLAGTGDPPGTLWSPSDVVPFAVWLEEPSGLLPFVDDGLGGQIVDPAMTLDRLPVVPLDRTPPPFGSVSTGRSEWLDFAGATLRARDLSGRSPPFFAPINGTYNAGNGGPVPAGKSGQVKVGAPVPEPGIPARLVIDAGFADPGLFAGPVGSGVPPNPPFNDIKVDAPDAGIGLEDVITDNATVTLEFQGAYPIRPGSHVPDDTTLTAWTSDLSALDGYPLVRFQVVFDLGADRTSFPYGVDSLRPQADYVRLRMEY